MGLWLLNFFSICLKGFAFIFVGSVLEKIRFFSFYDDVLITLFVIVYKYFVIYEKNVPLALILTPSLSLWHC